MRRRIGTDLVCHTGGYGQQHKVATRPDNVDVIVDLEKRLSIRPG